MRWATRIAVALAAAMLGYTSVANAAPYTTTGAPSSFLTLEIWGGEPGGEESVLAATIGPLSLSGTADLTLTGSSLAFNSSALILADSFGNFINLTDLGTTNADLVGVGVEVTSTDIPVTGGAWNLDSDPPTSFGLALNAGTITLYGHTGLLSALVDDPTVLDLAASPVTVSLEDLAGFNIGGASDPSLVSLQIPEIVLDVGGDALGAPGILFIRLYGDINLVPVPEPGTIAMLGMGAIGLLVVGRRRFRKA